MINDSLQLVNENAYHCHCLSYNLLPEQVNKKMIMNLKIIDKIFPCPYTYVDTD